ncbi:hypothetical protein QT196_23540 [Streptomyces sp. P9-2B-2]|uniref:hypothetical protein n=1 Tax=Streptomyces sp. P9-2B-2 TaxID=3057114 RepID=UPI0025B54E4F|nr:hypothetical protein [Streptomyces sp. P9-2B-2]WJY40011.1 hypothetical protein QT196_23540 [Streptomyces sp. P9-2B-2]
MTSETMTEAGERTEAGHDSPGLRAYLPTRQLARALCSGSAVLIGKGWAWITAEGAKEAGSRLLYSGFGLYAGAYVAHTTPQIVMPVVVVGWIGGALMFAPSPPPPGKAKPRVDLTKPAATEDQHQDLVEDQELDEPEPEPDLESVARLVRCLAGTQHQGAHLDDLLATGELGDWDKDALKDALAEWEIPVEEKGFKLTLDGRQRVRQGVRLRDLPAGAGEAPAAAGEGAPSGPPSAPAQAPASTPPEGPAETVADPSPPLAPETLSGAPVGG